LNVGDTEVWEGYGKFKKSGSKCERGDKTPASQGTRKKQDESQEIAKKKKGANFLSNRKESPGEEKHIKRVDCSSRKNAQDALFAVQGKKGL